MAEPYKVPFTYMESLTRQIATGPGGEALLVVSCDGPAILFEDSVHVGDFPSMREAREAVLERYKLNMTGEYPTISWTTVL